MTTMEAVNIASGVLLVAVAVWMRRSTTRTMSVFLAATGAAWTTLFASEAAFDGGPGRATGRLVFAAVLVVASGALGTIAWKAVSERRLRWVAAGVGVAVTAALFLGRGTQAGLDDATIARLARDVGFGAHAFALVLLALAAHRRASAAGAMGSAALLLFPGIVAGIYLHPDSHRNMLGVAVALVVVCALWIHNTTTDDRAASRRALFVALLALALPVLGLATVRLQGGIDLAADGPLRAAARTAGPILFALVFTRPSRTS